MVFVLRHTANEDVETAVQDLIVDTQFRIEQLMRDRKMTRANLARSLGVSNSRVTQLFGHRRNITLETVARIIHALGETPVVTSPRIEELIAVLKLESEKNEFRRIVSTAAISATAESNWWGVEAPSATSEIGSTPQGMLDHADDAPRLALT